MRTRLFAQALALLTIPAVGIAAFTSLTPNSAPRHLVLTAAGAAPVVGAPSTPPSGVVAPRPLTQGGLIPSVAYAPGAYQLLDLYLPDRASQQDLVPVIVYLHSGGWVSGSRSEVNDAAAAQVERGYAVASVDYQLASPGHGSFPGAVYDIKQAIRFLKVNAGTWGLDPNRIVVMGASAGGHLAALTGASTGQLEPDLTGPLASVDSSVIGVVDLVGITDLATFAVTPHPWAAALTSSFLGCPLAGGHANCSSDRLRQASVAPYVTANAPPIFMAYGGTDTLVVPATQGAPLAITWAKAHHGDPESVTYEVVPGYGHNLGKVQIDMNALDEFLDHAVGGPSLLARRVILYGDSLAFQARDFFQAALVHAGITQVTTRTYGGTAICDWFDQMRTDAATIRPDAVVIEFSGNALTTCMKALDGSPLSGDAYFQKYAQDASTVVSIFAPGKTQLFFAGAPISRRAELAKDQTTDKLHATYQTLAASTRFGSYIDAGASVTIGGRWTQTLPCLPDEPCTGGHDATDTPVNVVRAPDGAHFCPGAPAAVRGVTNDCQEWASGAWRFANAMAVPVIHALASE